MPTLQVQTNVALKGDAADRFFAAATEVVATGAYAAVAAPRRLTPSFFSSYRLPRVPSAWPGRAA